GAPRSRRRSRHLVPIQRIRSTSRFSHTRSWHFNCSPWWLMAQDFEQFVKEVFGGITQFSSDQMNRLNAKLSELVHEAIKDELAKLHGEIAELCARVAVREEERVEASAE